MKKIIIIGNGFDKAHDLKTDYDEFIEDLFKKTFDDRNSYKNILNSCSERISSYQDLITAVHKKYKTYSSKDNIPFRYCNISEEESDYDLNNKFIELLIHNKMTKRRWCDIEDEYFRELMRYSKANHDPKPLNNDFDTIRKYLIDYLKEEEKKAVRINSYEEFFKLFANSNDTLILNFNYTEIIEHLYAHVIKCPKIYIHGKLKDKKNPIIFGYATNREETKQLLSHNNNEYLQNIKKYLYKRTGNEKILLDFLKPSPNHDKIIVFILGHSCGLSDKWILNEIFNNESLFLIKTFYHNAKNYFDIQINIDRLMDNDKKFVNSIINYQSSHCMPQKNDKQCQIQEFIKHIKDHKNDLDKLS